MNFKGLVIVGVMIVLPVMPVPALAHHSYAEFDTQKQMTIQGTVKEWQWTNPHSWMLLMVPNAQGQAEQWAIEFNSVSLLAHQGWRPTTVTEGDKIAITFHPMKNGSHAGSFVSAKLANGRMMGGRPVKGSAAGTATD
jgi:hypothetical protein